MERTKIELKDNGYYEEAVEPFEDVSRIIDFLLELRLPDEKDKDKENSKEKENGKDKEKDKKKENDNVFWSFRGHRNEKWDLSIGHHTVETPEIDEDDDISGDKYDKWFKQYKKRMLYSRPHDYLNEKNPWWWLFYAKHHYLHTRLLDWTSNPLVAIYFAVENIESQEKENTGGAIWALKVNDKNFRAAEGLIANNNLPSSGHSVAEEKWFMINPEPVSQRIVLQSGKFTYHPGKNPKAINKMKRREGERLIKITIKPDADVIKKIRRQLGIMNIHHASLFPDASGIAYFVNSEWPDIASY